MTGRRRVTETDLKRFGAKIRQSQMSEVVEKRIIIIAGPNGAGKTTFALEYLPNESGCPLFVNADLIADGLSPFDPSAVSVRAGRLMIEEINRHARSGANFAFETTLAGRRYVQQNSALATEWLPRLPDFSATSE